MIPLFLLPKIFLASGAVLLGTIDTPATPPFQNHTLKAELVPAAKVVTRDCWGTPMLPNVTMGYSLIAPISKKLIAQSLWIPPVLGSRPVEAPLLEPAPVSPVLASPSTAPIVPSTSAAPATTPPANP